jgi:mono/diheme cytochrome c family protein
MSVERGRHTDTLPALAALMVVLAVTLTVVLTGCANDWRTDMWYQPALQPHESPRPQPAQSVPLGVSVMPANRDSAQALVDPVARDSSSIRHGRFLFAQRCACCHGAAARGGGPVSKYFPPAPDLTYAAVKARSDGYIWGTITFGGRAMPAQPEGLTVNDRWDLVNLIRVLQASAPSQPGQAPAAAPQTPTGAPAESSASGSSTP